MPPKKKQVSESKTLQKVVEAEAKVIKDLGSRHKTAQVKQKKKTKKSKSKSKQSKMTSSAGSEQFHFKTQFQHPPASLEAFNSLIAPDKSILDSTMVGTSRYPDGFNATSTAVVSTQYNVELPSNSARLVIPYLTGPLYNADGTVPGSNSAVIGLVSTYDPSTDGIKAITNTNYNTIEPTFGNLLANTIMGEWSSSTGRIEGTGRNYKLRSGIARVRYEPNATTQCKFEGFQTVTGTEGAFPSSGGTNVSLVNFRKDCKKNQFRFGTFDEPGCCVRFTGSTEYSLFRSPFPANNLFNGVPDIAAVLRKMVIGERLSPAQLVDLGFGVIPSDIPPVESLDYVPAIIIYNDTPAPVNFLIEIGYTLEFLPEQNDGLPVSIAPVDPYWNELASINNSLPWFTGPHSFWSSLWDGVKSVASFGWNNVVKPIFAPAASQAVQLASGMAQTAVQQGAQALNAGIASRMMP